MIYYNFVSSSTSDSFSFLYVSKYFSWAHALDKKAWMFYLNFFFSSTSLWVTLSVSQLSWESVSERQALNVLVPDLGQILDLSLAMSVSRHYILGSQPRFNQGHDLSPPPTPDQVNMGEKIVIKNDK